MQIEAKVVADSVSPYGARLTTIEGTIHRFVLAELSKHRLLSISAQSSRAVPVAKMVEQVKTAPAFPIHWGKKQRGMRADEECFNAVDVPGYLVGQTREDAWGQAANVAAWAAEEFDKAEYHKQIVNRLLEPFLWQRVVITATEWQNFFNLRIHSDAQPEIRAFAEAVWEAMDVSDPEELMLGAWHLPFVVQGQGQVTTTTSGEVIPTLEQAKKYSAARCATTSYRTDTLSVEKALEIYDTLTGTPIHAVPFEHVARPLSYLEESDELTTHTDRQGKQWCGNLKGWGTMRKELTGAELTV